MNLQSAVVGGREEDCRRLGNRAPPARRIALCRTPDACVDAGLPASTVAAATVNGRWKLASRPGPFAGEPAPTTACAEPPMRVCRSGFTREYGGGGNGDRQVEIGQQGRPFRG